MNSEMAVAVYGMIWYNIIIQRHEIEVQASNLLKVGFVIHSSKYPL